MNNLVREININTQDDVKYLIMKLQNDEVADKFIFASRELIDLLLAELDITKSEFEERWYYVNKEKKLHISESEHGYIWISNIGLIADKSLIYIGETNNQYIRMLNSQYELVTLLIDRLLSLCEKEEVYDVDSIAFESLHEIAPMMFHNIIFYLELFAKSYLYANEIKTPNTHSLLILYNLMVNTMFYNKQNDSLFHKQLLNNYKEVVSYIINIPNNFKEQYVKYDDNEYDYTVILVDEFIAQGMKRSMDLFNDFTGSLCSDGLKSFYLKSGMYERILSNYSNAEELKILTNKYKYLVDKELNRILDK